MKERRVKERRAKEQRAKEQRAKEQRVKEQRAKEQKAKEQRGKERIPNPPTDKFYMHNPSLRKGYISTSDLCYLTGTVVYSV